MADASRLDAWQAGDSYEAYMGRWSRAVALRFVDWLDLAPGLDWLEIGCGTGALSEAVLSRGRPARLSAIDASDGFVAAARASVPDDRAEFRVGDAHALALADASCDVVVSGLVLNFLPDRAGALAEMRRVTRPGGCVGFYVWDYPGGGMQMMRTFWQSAAALDPEAAGLTEDRRFPFCTPGGLTELATEAGFASVRCAPIEVPTGFRDFEDFWHPFTLGAGPAPGYCASLSAERQGRLRDHLEGRVRPQADGTIAMTARAWAVRSIAG